MSVHALTWALEDAPDVPPHLVATLLGLANHAAEDGRGSYPSQARLARYTRKGERNVRRDLDALEGLGLIRRGDQRYTAHLPPDRRPVVWDLAMERRRPAAPRAGERGRPTSRDDAHVTPSTETGGRTRPPETGGRTRQNGGAHTSPRGGAHTSAEPSPRTVPEPSPSPQPPAAPPAPSVPAAREGEGAETSPDPDQTTPPAPSGAGSDPAADDEHQDAAAEILAGLGTTVRTGARAGLLAQISRCLTAGHSRETIAAEITRDLAGARSVTAVVSQRLTQLAGLPPAPAPAIEQHTGTEGPPWCGQCTEHGRIRDMDGDRPHRCPDCHPERVRRGQAPAGDDGEQGPAPAPGRTGDTRARTTPAPAACTEHGRRVCVQCSGGAVPQPRRDGASALARLLAADRAEQASRSAA